MTRYYRRARESEAFGASSEASHDLRMLEPDREPERNRVFGGIRFPKDNIARSIHQLETERRDHF